jgi:hypothetical protein
MQAWTAEQVARKPEVALRPHGAGEILIVILFFRDPVQSRLPFAWQPNRSKSKSGRQGESWRKLRRVKRNTQI